MTLIWLYSPIAGFPWINHDQSSYDYAKLMMIILYSYIDDSPLQTTTIRIQNRQMFCRLRKEHPRRVPKVCFTLSNCVLIPLIFLYSFLHYILPLYCVSPYISLFLSSSYSPKKLRVSPYISLFILPDSSIRIPFVPGATAVRSSSKPGAASMLTTISALRGIPSAPIPGHPDRMAAKWYVAAWRLQLLAAMLRHVALLLPSIQQT